MNRRKAIKTLSLAIIASYFTVEVFNNSGSQKTNHFIGLGDAGFDVIKTILEDKKPINSCFTSINSEARIHHQSINTIVLPVIYEKVNKERMNKNIEIFDLEHPLRELFEANHQFIFIAGLGGKAGNFWMEYLTDYLIKTNADFLSIVSTPFSFEGEKQKATAQHIVNKYKNIPQFHYFPMDILKKKYGDLPISKAFDKQINIYYNLIFNNLQNINNE